jgi:tRNA 2-thiocytidine biosynthesis protein TtcA
MRFPLIPCTLCGSQPNLQRGAIKAMLTGWEREFPGRLESIFTALRNVESATLADQRVFDFKGLRALATMSEQDEEAIEAELSGE